MRFVSAVSANFVSFCSTACFSWTSGSKVAGALVMVVIASFVGSKYFSVFTQDTAISWYVNELYYTVVFSINGGTGAYLVKYKLVFFCPRVADEIRMASISAGFFALNGSLYRNFHFLFPRASILVGLTSNDVAGSSSTWNTKYFVTLIPNPFLQFPDADPVDWIRIGSCDPCTLIR